MRCVSLVSAGSLLFLSIAATARADEVTFSQPISTQAIGTTTGFTSSIDFSFNKSLPKFDASQGTLQQVQFSGSFLVRLFGDADTADLYLPCSATYDGSFETEPLLAQTQEFQVSSGPFNETSTLTYSGELITNPTILAAVTGSGTGNLALFDVPDGSFLSVTVDEPPELVALAADPSGSAELVSGSLSVTYTFVPEPASLSALAGIGVLLVRHRRVRPRI